MTKWTLKDGRVLMLLTPEEFETVPNGATLTNIFGDRYIKGLDKIDNYTRFGHLAFGFIKGEMA